MHVKVFMPRHDINQCQTDAQHKQQPVEHDNHKLPPENDSLPENHTPIISHFRIFLYPFARNGIHLSEIML